MRNKVAAFLLISTVLISCKTNQDLTGKYRSNFADLGFFITVIDLKPDKSFHYECSGDLIHQEFDGRFKISGNKLYLRFDKLMTEPAELTFADTLVFNSDWQNTHSYILKNENGIEYHLKYRIRRNKLQTYHLESDKIVRRAKIYTDKRKYILFGPTCYKKKWYLKEIK